MFGATHLSLLAFGVPLSEALVVAGMSFVSGIGLAAIALRLGTLWPLIVWHFLQNSFPAFLTAGAMGVWVPINLVVVFGVALLGAWILWADRHVGPAEGEPSGDLGMPTN
jgi:hypothetical protein